MIHREITFEDEICGHLAAHGWLHEPDAAARYDRARALYPPDLLAWVQQTQPDAWSTLHRLHGARAPEVLLDRVRGQLDQRGTLDVLRRGVELTGLRAAVKLAEFKPALGLNAQLQARYEANRLRVVRQLRYSVHNDNCLDLGLFLNGVAVATAELKSDFTQSVEDAIDQYRHDRPPVAKGQKAEPLLGFPGGALVHFAVSNSAVFMSTHLQGPDTRFLPFNRGNAGGAGNAPNPAGHATAYLWEQVWARESWLELLGRVLVARRDRKGRIHQVLFPRYHQLDVVRLLVAAVLRDGPGGRYLVQHSAGSGKTNSIAWTAHFLADLHDAQQRKVFDTVLVVSDRNVIDAQLQEALFDFERTTGVVVSVTGESRSKSGELASALGGGKKIVVCTLQTFPYALAEVQRQAATMGRRFAVLADEAHSSQSGEAAKRLRQVLSAAELAELADGGEFSTEDLLAAQMSAQASEQGITFVAFTATPKARTLELFGTRPDPIRKPAPDNVPQPFHVYSMRQAIEEGFILDVLRNYTSYSLAFRLAMDERELDERQVDRTAALRRVMGWVRLHPYNIAQKVAVVVEHFRTQVAPLLDGGAKAMVVVSSRLEAVRWQLALTEHIRKKGLSIGALVAFSGEVVDPERGPEGLSEQSAALNPGLRGRDIREAFDRDEYQILLVANKFQTGFDQPRLCGMYVDRKLAGIQAVQTLSRLNRAHPGKDTTFIVDFVNDPAEILRAFKTYYDTAELITTTDPDLVYNLKAELDATGLYEDAEVERVVLALLGPHSTQAALSAAIQPVCERMTRKHRVARLAEHTAREQEDEAAAQEARQEREHLELIRRKMGTYVRLYTFLAQIFDYGNTAPEKLALFLRALLAVLEFGRERDSLDLGALRLTHHTLRRGSQVTMPLQLGEAPRLSPATEAGTGTVQDREKAHLREIIERVNALFEGDLTEGDQLVYVNNVILGKLLESDRLAQQAQANSRQQFASSPDLMPELEDALMSAMDAHQKMSAQALNSKQVREGLLDLLLNHLGLWERLRARA